VETVIAASRACVTILSKKFLWLASSHFAMNVAQKYGCRIVLVHDQSTCEFPGPDQQPKDIQEVFHDKAVTYMKQYVRTCTRQVLRKSYKFPGMTKTFDLCILYEPGDKERLLALPELKKLDIFTIEYPQVA